MVTMLSLYDGKCASDKLEKNFFLTLTTDRYFCTHGSLHILSLSISDLEKLLVSIFSHFHIIERVITLGIMALKIKAFLPLPLHLKTQLKARVLSILL